MPLIIERAICWKFWILVKLKGVQSCTNWTLNSYSADVSTMNLLDWKPVQSGFVLSFTFESKKRKGDLLSSPVCALSVRKEEGIHSSRESKIKKLTWEQSPTKGKIYSCFNCMEEEALLWEREWQSREEKYSETEREARQETSRGRKKERAEKQRNWTFV